jgi:hypothetical protein
VHTKLYRNVAPGLANFQVAMRANWLDSLRER